jgi:excisionase family DNA binding protein
VLGADDVPPYRLTHAQAAVLLGVHEITVSKWVSRGWLPSVGRYAKANLLRSDVEQLSAARWRPGDRSWLTTSQAAEVMGVTDVRVNQLARAGRLPHELSRDGWRLFRPGQVAVIGNARRVRFQPDDG